ncbi:Rhodanese-like protein [Diplogelasinospora grovesii]|uniref:Rhodanese-like protein n=1 Tax=Diplogelasinospora grovesii TaxID=303347 RepID=A0AAN6RYX0_9PEZI|nr:Rhodanese-like protein [Diplogelasinospora grovesii]
MTSTTQGSAAVAPLWHAAYPAPKIEAPSLTRETVLEMLRDGNNVSGRDFVLVDLRRNDHEGGSIRGSINLPAQSLWSTIPIVYEMFKAAGLRKVIWFCGRVFTWSRKSCCRLFADHIAERGDTRMQSLVLLEGIKGWATAGEEYVQWMDEYDEAVWHKSKS